MYKIHTIEDNLSLIELVPPIAGFDRFIGAWLYQDQFSFLIDVGPAITIPDLLSALTELNITELDYILLTHIHIDHAGGIGDIARHFPKTPIICHQSGIPHLIDPTRLSQGSIKTLGDVGRAYGPIKPVNPDLLLDAKGFRAGNMTAIATPGHAAHHFSYKCNKYLFAGEASGVFLTLPSGRTYLRPATPPRFFLETSLKSIELLVSQKAKIICLGHFGVYPEILMTEAGSIFARHKAQLLLWHRLLSEKVQQTPKHDEAFISSCIDFLLRKDQLLAGFTEMSAPVQIRERDFLKNSVKGFVGYLEFMADNS